MQRLGKVVTVTPSKSVVVKLDKTPQIGSTVIDETLQVVGKVFDIIGPVPAPYAVVRPTVKTPEKLANKPLYLLLSKKERKHKA